MIEWKKRECYGKIFRINYVSVGYGLSKELKTGTILLISKEHFLCLKSEDHSLFPSNLKYETVSNIVYYLNSYEPLVEILTWEMLG